QPQLLSRWFRVGGDRWSQQVGDNHLWLLLLKGGTMRSVLSTTLIALLVAVGITACSSSSSTASSSTDNSATSAAADNSATAATGATSDSSASTAASGSSGASSARAAAVRAAPPVYAGAESTTDPGRIRMKALQKSVKVYDKTDDFAKVKAWYKG